MPVRCPEATLERLLEADAVPARERLDGVIALLAEGRRPAMKSREARERSARRLAPLGSATWLTIPTVRTGSACCGRGLGEIWTGGGFECPASRSALAIRFASKGTLSEADAIGYP